MAIYLITNHKKGISSVQLGKDIGVTQKSAWFMLHRLRHASKTKTFQEFQGTVEADECYVESADKENLLPKIGCNVKAGSNVITDSYHAYNNLKNNYKHDVIKHSANEYVRIDTSREAFKSIQIQ